MRQFLKQMALGFVSAGLILGLTYLLPEIDIRGDYEQPWVEFVSNRCPEQAKNGPKYEATPCSSQALEEFFKRYETVKVEDK